MRNQKKVSLIIAISLFLFIFCFYPLAKFNESLAASGSTPAKTGEAVSFPIKSAPGLYVNSSPAFSVSYPSNWLEKPPESQYSVNYRFETPEGFPSMRISAIPDMCGPLKYSTQMYMSGLTQIGKDIKLIYDKEIKLEDGRQAQEIELEWVDNTGVKLNTIYLTAKKECTWIAVSLTNNKGRVNEELKKIAYSLKIKPEEDSLKANEDLFFPAKLTEPVANAKEVDQFPQAKAQKIDEARLIEASRVLSGNEDTICLLVERNGVMVLEKYFHGNTAERNFDVRSVTKSVSSILIGIAIDKGFIKSVDQPISEFLGKVYKDLPAEKGKITIRDLLTMSSGLPWHELNTFQQDIFPWMNSPNQLRWILDKPYEYAPGKQWHYNTGASHILSVVLQEATGMSSKEFAQKYLFEPFGSQVKHWSTDKQGFFYGGQGICLDGRTMIKIGSMLLNNGRYNGKQVISSKWAAESVKTRYPANNAFPWSDGYGYLWWTGKDVVTGLSYFMATGYGGQFIICIPSKNTVIAAGTEWLSFSKAIQNLFFVPTTILLNILPALQ